MDWSACARMVSLHTKSVPLKKIFMKVLIVIDAQNEFSAQGKRPVPGHSHILDQIRLRVEHARQENWAIAWIRHHNRPHESPAFVPGTWGAGYSPGLGPKPGRGLEVEFQKDVYGAFTGTNIGSWITQLGINKVLLCGFYTHGCVSTTAREAIMNNLEVFIDIDTTGACDIQHETLGVQTADEVRRSALLHLENLGVKIVNHNKQQTLELV